MFDPFPVEISREAFASSWTTEDDRWFWRRLRGNSGLLQIWWDAHRLTNHCLRAGIHPSDKEFLVARMHLMTLCVGLSLAEVLARIFSPQLPHFFARFAVQAFCEMLGRTELIAEEHPDVFHGDDWDQIGYDYYRSPLGTTAR
jgi:hypothetical protein